MPTQPWQTTDFPDWLGQAPVGQMKQLYGDIPGLFDFSNISAAANRAFDSTKQAGLQSAQVAGRAANNRAMQSGGRVGSSFATASASLPVLGQYDKSQLGLADMNLQNNQRQAALMAQLAQGIAGAKLQNRGIKADYSLGMQGLQQRGDQFGEEMDLRRDQFGLQEDQFGLDQQMSQLQIEEMRRRMAQQAAQWGGGGTNTQFSAGWGGRAPMMGGWDPRMNASPFGSYGG